MSLISDTLADVNLRSAGCVDLGGPGLISSSVFVSARLANRLEQERRREFGAPVMELAIFAKRHDDCVDGGLNEAGKESKEGGG